MNPTITFHSSESHVHHPPSIFPRGHIQLACGHWGSFHKVSKYQCRSLPTWPRPSNGRPNSSIWSGPRELVCDQKKLRAKQVSAAPSPCTPSPLRKARKSPVSRAHSVGVPCGTDGGRTDRHQPPVLGILIKQQHFTFTCTVLCMQKTI